MKHLILSTSNIMNTAPSILPRRPTFEKSNTEFTNSLRSHFKLAQSTLTPPSSSKEGSSSAIPNGTSISTSPATPDSTIPSKDLPPWTHVENSTLYIPRLDFTHTGLAEEREQYDITVKLFFLPTTRTTSPSSPNTTSNASINSLPNPPSPSSQNQNASPPASHIHSALSLVLSSLHVSSIDLLIISFPGISFDADDDSSPPTSPPLSPPISAPQTQPPHPTPQSPPSPSHLEDLEDPDLTPLLKIWSALEPLHTPHGTVKQLGLAEFGSERLRRFIPKTKVRPSVDQINVRDCCVVPRELIQYAKREGVELLTHNDCTDVLPTGTVRELLRGAGLCVGEGGGGKEEEVGKEDGEEEGGKGEGMEGGWLRGEILPQWVVKYTAVVRDRGVIESKGYFAGADVEG